MMARALWLCFLALLVAFPLALGGYRPWAWSLAGALLSLMLFGWGALVVSGRMAPFWRGLLWLPLGGYAAVLGWLLIQGYLPVSGDAVHPIWQLAGAELGVPLSGRISAAPQDGAAALIRFLSAGACLWLGIQFGRDRDRALGLLRWLSVAGAVYALYGVLNYLAGNDYLLWYPRWAYRDDVTSSFVNRNSYATFAGMTVLLCVAMAMHAYRGRIRDVDPGRNALDRWLAGMAGVPALYAAGAAVGAIALFQSHSRMGLVAGVAGALVFLVFTYATRLLRGWIPIGLLVASAGMIALFSATTVLDRFADGRDSARGEILQSVGRAIESAPLLGTGYGSFAAIYPMYREPEVAPGTEILMAHSTYFEMAMTAGIPATIVILLALIVLLAIMIHGGLTRQRDRIVPILGTACAAIVGVHSLLDFSFQIPAIAYWLMAIMGVAVAQSFATGQPARLAAPRAHPPHPGTTGDAAPAETIA